MNIVVIGLGSMGKRRIRLLKMLNDKNEIIGIDSRDERRKEVNRVHGVVTYSSIEDIRKEQKIDCAFVCTSPLSHNSIIHECLQNKWDVFTELNLVSDGYRENMELAKKNGCVLFLSSTFLYREEINYIRKFTIEKQCLNYIYHIGQYLPDWHPWENYNDFFVGDKKTNGCREIMAIELPWLIETFGEIINFQVMTDKMSNLKINYNDNYLIEFKHANGNKGVLAVDVVSPIAVRNLEVYGENIYLRWDGTPTGLQHFDCEERRLKHVNLNETIDKIEGYRDFIVENAYRNEIQDFMDVIAGRKVQQYGFEKDYDILNLIDQIEEAICGN